MACRILIVEDEALVARDIACRMESAGYEVVATVGEGCLAIEQVEQNEVDLILMDIMINGELDGIETAERILAKKDYPVVFLTAFEDTSTIARAKEVAPYGYLVKPFETRDLKLIIEMALVRFDLEQKMKNLNSQLEERVAERTAELQKAHTVLAQKEAELRRFSHQLIQIREDEQRRIANDLHDEVGALVVAVTSSLSVAEADIRDGQGEKALECIARAKAIVREEVDNLKKIATSLRPPNLEIIGLIDALRLYFSQLTDTVDVKINYNVDIDDESIVGEEKAIVLYRVAQEALTNVLKHAQASNVHVRLFIEENHIGLELKDDGKGFSLDSADAVCTATRAKMGVVGMRERVESMGGTFIINSYLQEGTEVKVMLPLAQ